MASEGYAERLKGALDSTNIGHLVVFARAMRRADMVYVLGNGGSQANAAHLVLHLRDNNIRAFDMLADSAWVSATSNDYNYDDLPKHMPICRPNDILFVISGSGDSPNVLTLLDTPNVIKIGLLGMKGGAAALKCTSFVIVGSDEYGIIEDIHLTCIHILNELLKEGA